MPEVEVEKGFDVPSHPRPQTLGQMFQSTYATPGEGGYNIPDLDYDNELGTPREGFSEILRKWQEHLERQRLLRMQMEQQEQLRQMEQVQEQPSMGFAPDPIDWTDYG